MANFNLTKNDLEDIGSLMNISYSLLDNFIKLRDLEINGGYGSDEYKATIECLKSTLSLEESFYNRFGNHPLKLQAILNEFVKPNKAWDINDDLQISLSTNKDNLVKRRIILKLIDKMCSSKVTNTVKSPFNNALEISMSVKKDIINTLLTLLNLYLHDPKYQQIASELENLKYNIGFLYQFVEKDFLDNEFAINPELYWTANLTANFKRVPSQVVDTYKKSYAGEMLEKVLQDIIAVSVYDLRNKDGYAKAIILQVLIRTGLLFSGEELVKNLEERFATFITMNKMLNADNSGEFLVMEAIKLHTSDKTIPKIVTLGVNR